MRTPGMTPAGFSHESLYAERLSFCSAKIVRRRCTFAEKVSSRTASALLPFRFADYEQNAKTVAFLAVSATAVKAQVVTINSSTLSTIPVGNPASHTYTGLDGSGTTLTVSRTSGASHAPLIGGTWPGLWFGGNQSSGVYSFTFDRPVTFFEYYFTAMSTGGGTFSEVLDQFTANGTASLSYTNVMSTTWDGSAIFAQNANASALLAVTASAGQSFTTLSFRHQQTGSPNGSVIERIRYDAGPQNAVVPEPSTYVMMATGLAALVTLARRRRVV